jgi:hypothetical protein
MPHDERPDGWLESTEGDLDPDLADETPYSEWEAPPARAWWPLVYRAVAFVLIAALVLPALVALLR